MIVAIGGRSVRSADDVARMLVEHHHPGQSVTFLVVRGRASVSASPCSSARGPRAPTPVPEPRRVRSGSDGHRTPRTSVERGANVGGEPLPICLDFPNADEPSAQASEHAVRLTIPAKPEYITLLRLALTGLAAAAPAAGRDAR